MRLSWPSHKCDIYNNPVPASFEADVTLILCVKVKKIVYIHQILAVNKDGWFSAEILKISNKWLNFKLRKKCRFVLQFFNAAARTGYCKGLCQMSAYSFHTVWRVSVEKPGIFPFHLLFRFVNPAFPMELFCCCSSKRGVTSNYCMIFCRQGKHVLER